MDFEEKLSEFHAKVDKISKITDPVKSMRAYLKMTDFLEDIWEDGRQQGIVEGKNYIVNKKRNEKDKKNKNPKEDK